MSVKTGNIKAGKTISFSGYYEVTFIHLLPPQAEMGTIRQVDLEFKTLHGDVYDIQLRTNRLTINHRVRSFANSPYYGQQPEELHWIPKYMIKPTKLGKALFELNPVFIQKLWGLVADDAKMKQLKRVGAPWSITLNL